MNIKLYKRNKRWHYHFSFHGKQYRGSTYTDTKELANLYTQKIYNEFYVNKHHIKYSNILLSEFIQFHPKTQENMVAKVLGVTAEELLTGRKGSWPKKENYTPEQQKYIDKLIEIFNSNDEEKKTTVKIMLDNLKRDPWKHTHKKSKQQEINIKKQKTG